jgi:hypothetical protein
MRKLLIAFTTFTILLAICFLWNEIGNLSIHKTIIEKKLAAISRLWEQLPLQFLFFSYINN